MEVSRFVRSTKIIILALFVIFINILIVEPLRAMSISTGYKLSAFEPYVAIGNSGMIVLILPILFLVIIADFPREGESLYFFNIRCSKRIWVLSQILYAIMISVILAFFVFVISVLLSLDFTDWSMDYSSAVTKYVSMFPERAGEYVVELVPENLYNQMSLFQTLIHTTLLLISYLIMLSMLLLVFSLIKKKIIGIFMDCMLIVLGTIASAVRMRNMWLFPMPHTITWLHYTEYSSVPLFPIGWSYLYFGIINLLLMVLAFSLSKQYNEV